MAETGVVSLESIDGFEERLRRLEPAVMGGEGETVDGRCDPASWLDDGDLSFQPCWPDLCPHDLVRPKRPRHPDRTTVSLSLSRLSLPLAVTCLGSGRTLPQPRQLLWLFRVF